MNNNDTCPAKERDVEREKDCENGKISKESKLRFHPNNIRNQKCQEEATSKFQQLQTLCDNSRNTSGLLLEADKNKKNNDVIITTKIYPTNYRNRKGFQVGNMKIKFDTKNTPFTSADQIDQYLGELFSYIKWATTKKDPKDETIEDRKKSIYDFLKAKKIEHVFTPKFIVDENKGGKAKSTRKGSRKSKRKTNKKKSKVFKGGNNDEKIQKYIMDSINMELPDQLESVLKMYPEYADKPLTTTGKVPIQLAYEINDKDSRTDIVSIIESYQKNKKM